MEWVEVRGQTLDEAKEEALDQLGVDRDDAEFEIVQEAESRWMGLKKTEARVRARVRPTTPPPKREGGRNNRRARGNRSAEGGSNQRRGGRNRGGQQGGQQKQRQPKQQQSKQRNDGGAKQGRSGSGRNGRSPDRGPKRDSVPAEARTKKPATKKETAVDDRGRSGEVMPIEEQQQMVSSFLEGLVDSFGIEATITTRLEEDTLVGAVDGDDLGLLVGPRGGTLRAIQELSRSAVQKSSDGRDTNRLMIDVASYRERRRAALAEFAQTQAQKVIESGAEVALEPMSSADRKAIHDAVVEIADVQSISRGDDPYRKVVLIPDS